MFGTGQWLRSLLQVPRINKTASVRLSVRRPRPPPSGNVVTNGREIHELTKTPRARKLNDSRRSWFQPLPGPRDLADAHRAIRRDLSPISLDAPNGVAQ
jgi:hypothetical protein